ncbi:hypothetical protein DUNSADRAFT_6670 [Dunaliella salina]|uniref:Uncharacterized protein n=1 Tax=Dunaliella salina TaxID=3046 RepID=A0ABQ7GMU0_DUNSA|nr:hypothetical protein DUNSADRAFT_6670 [Dunaliella salina]|eukprot:KAF5835913.1 hypothetical protein DUNSADRAFT_6670 [Dunaliella salina]
MLSSTLFEDLEVTPDEEERRLQEAMEEQRAAEAMQNAPPTKDFNVIKKHWLINWLEQLKHRLPPFQVKKMGIEKKEWSQNISDDRLDTVLQHLPAHEMQRLERMFARTAGIVDTLSTAMDLELVDYQVNAAQERHKHRSNAMVTASLDREAEPWQLIMGRFDKETGAAVTIQRAYRAFAARCKLFNYWPSDENPLHWKHWVEFRRQHGWGKEEMFDAKGNKIKRPQPKSEGRVKARYLETQSKKSQASIAQDFEARTALRNFARAQRMAEILQAKLAKTQEYDAKRREMQEKEQARLRAIQARHRAKFSGVDVRGALLDPVQRRALITQSVQELNAGRVLTQPLYRDFKCTQSFANRLNPPAHLFDLMQHFSAIHMYRKKLEVARKRGLAAPPLPDGADAEIIAMYDEVMANLTLKYKEDVETAYLQRRVPEAPPEGVRDDGVALYHDVLKRFKRLETGYDSDDAQPGKPRVRSLTGYGKDWLSAFEQSSRRRKRLLRVRSQGALGIHAASLPPSAVGGDAVYAALAVLEGAYAQSSSIQRTTPVIGEDEASPPVSYCSTPVAKPSTPQPAGYPPTPPSNRSSSNHPPDILSVGYPPPEVSSPLPAPPRKANMPTYLPLSTAAARKLAASVACCKMRLKRPLQLKDTAEMCGNSWFGLDMIVEGQCSPFACNDLFLLASILRTEWLPAAERAARKSAASSYMRQSSAGSTGVGPGNDGDRQSFAGSESGAARGLQVLGRRSIAHRPSNTGADSAYHPSRRSTCHNFSGLNPREALARSSAILHSPSGPLDGAANLRPLSACGVRQANECLAHAQQQQAVRACAQWDTNEDAVLGRTAAPAPACTDTQNGEGGTRKEPGDVKDGEGSPMRRKRKAKKAASSLPPALKAPNPGVPNEADDNNHELSPWGTLSPAAPASAPHTDSSTSPTTPPLPHSRPSAFSYAAAFASTSFKSTPDAPKPRASGGSIGGAGSSNLGGAGSLQQLCRAPPLGTAGSGALPGEADGKGEKEEDEERGKGGWVTPSITWTLMQHAWALGGLPREHYAQRSLGAKGLGRDK